MVSSCKYVEKQTYFCHTHNATTYCKKVVNSIFW